MLKKRWYFAGLLLLVLAGLFCLARFSWCLVPEPETCVLCDQEPEEVPCLLDCSTGELGPMAGTALPGKFQYVGVLGVLGGWDSDAQRAVISVPGTSDGLNPYPFCRSCRWDLDRQTRGTYAMVDLSDPAHPVFYPLQEGEASILGYFIAVTMTEDGFEVTVRGETGENGVAG